MAGPQTEPGRRRTTLPRSPCAPAIFGVARRREDANQRVAAQPLRCCPCGAASAPRQPGSVRGGGGGGRGERPCDLLPATSLGDRTRPGQGKAKAPPGGENVCPEERGAESALPASGPGRPRRGLSEPCVRAGGKRPALGPGEEPRRDPASERFPLVPLSVRSPGREALSLPCGPARPRRRPRAALPTRRGQHQVGYRGAWPTAGRASRHPLRTQRAGRGEGAGGVPGSPRRKGSELSPSRVLGALPSRRWGGRGRGCAARGCHPE